MKINFLAFLIAGLLSGVLSLAENPPPATPDFIKQGKISYTKNCATCHGPKGNGRGVAAKGLNPRPRNFLAPRWLEGTDAKSLFGMITSGVPGGAMASYQYLSEKERWALAYYVKSFVSKK